MAAYLGDPEYSHLNHGATGLLFTNLGTPDAPSTGAVRRYLVEFLWDPRVIEMPRLLWWLILHGVILRIRPSRSAALYQRVWTDEGSPLLAISQRQVKALEARLASHFHGPLEVALGMRYGNPSIAEALAHLRDAGVRRLLVLPLYPQYSATTTASTFDAFADVLKRWRWLPELRFVTHYHDHPGYIQALARSIQEAWQREGPAERLLFSFHGLPERYLHAGDPYHCACRKTARLVAEHLDLPPERWALSFQSRVGREEWLKPYTDEQLKAWGAAGVKSVDVICPGFSADCLETLDEIAVENREFFRAAGGETFRYIHALNDRPDHIDALADVVLTRTQDWQGLSTPKRSELEATRERALALGAAH